MKKRIFLSLAAVVAIVLGVVGFSAFEAHVINVTATIENALTVPVEPINFGTVFPQEQLDRQFDIALSQSFLDESRVADVQYMIRQKPKCAVTTDNGEVLVGPTATGHIVVGDDPATTDAVEEYWINCGEAPRELATGETWGVLPSLCPYLSKHQLDTEESSVDVSAFHEPFTIVNGQVVYTEAKGDLLKPNDLSDKWNIDLKVPCFGGYCAQDWAEFVTGINPDAVPANYTQPIANEHKVFGCDLWVEVTGVSEAGDNNIGCLDNISCNDNNACTEDICNAQNVCEYAPLVYADANPCTEEYCDPINGPQYPLAPDGTVCAVAFAGTCQAGICTPVDNTTTETICDDGLDNDGDQATDCEDSDCANAANCQPELADSDFDGVADSMDNCPSTANPNQEDSDSDGVGDACDGYSCLPAGAEICGNIADEDCDGTAQACCTNGDGDGFYEEGSTCGTEADCDDSDFFIYPGAAEVCNDGIDQNCDGQDCITAVCGNGIKETGEGCDDGNTVSLDGCDAVCVDEYCGDGIVNDSGREQCDGTAGISFPWLHFCTPACYVDPL